MNRKAIGMEIAVVLLVTFGLSGMQAVLALVNAQLNQGGIGATTVALNVPRSELSYLDLAYQLLGTIKLFAWAGLGLYLLWRRGFGPSTVGLRRITGRDWLWGAGLAALIGIPGLGLYLLAHSMGVNAAVVPSNLTETWWRTPALVINAVANSAAEEIVVVAWLMTRLRQLELRVGTSVVLSALLRGSYHLYQGLGGGVGNVVMGLIFGAAYARTQRLWPLIVAHALIDSVAFVGYALLKPHLSWLP